MFVFERIKSRYTKTIAMTFVNNDRQNRRL